MPSPFTPVCSVAGALVVTLASCAAIVRAAASGPVAERPREAPLVISAAASLADVLEEIKPLYLRAQPAASLSYNFGGSGTLELEIERGAPVDIFISAASEQMDGLAGQGLLLPQTRVNVASNRVVLIAPREQTNDSPHISGFADLAKPEVRNIAIGDPASVPAGHYAQQVLEHAGIWPLVANKSVRAADVRQVLAYVESGDADAGIVYATDARVTTRVRVIAVAPPGWHTPVVYPAAVLASCRDADRAREFLHFLLRPRTQAIFAKYGFSPPPQ